jgi:hypothetical protein
MILTEILKMKRKAEIVNIINNITQRPEFSFRLLP